MFRRLNGLPVILLTGSLSVFAAPLEQTLRFQSPDGAKRSLEGPPDEITELKKQLETLLGEAQPLLDRLSGMPQQYQRAASWDALLRERQDLRTRIGLALDVIEEKSKTFSLLRKSWEARELQKGMRQLASTGQLSADAPLKFIGNLEFERFSMQVNSFVQLAAATVKNEEEGFRSFEKARQLQRRQLRWVAAAVSLLTLLGATFAWRYSRRVRSLEHEMTARLSTRPAPTGPLPDNLAPGAILAGSYRIERELGRGGMGVVYEALDTALQRKVAIKRMHGGVAQDPQELELFLREARFVAALRHPNIVEIFAVTREGGQLFLVFEHVPGEPLNRYLARAKRMPLAHVQGALRQVALALDYAHAAKIVHRDLKPSNIMLTPKGVLKVMDFGIAYQAKKTLAKLSRTSAWGTPPYMAPEQELGEVTVKADIFALGVMCYEMLSGRIPFDGPNYLEQKRTRRYAPLAKPLGLPAALDAVLAKALDPDPAGRFPSAGQLAAALEAVK
ncbi:MAG: serine/threonine-protein kinase [Elusimicrobiota bacterium]